MILNVLTYMLIMNLIFSFQHYLKKNSSAATQVDLITPSWLSNTCLRETISLSENIVFEAELFIFSV